MLKEKNKSLLKILKYGVFDGTDFSLIKTTALKITTRATNGTNFHARLGLLHVLTQLINK